MIKESTRLGLYKDLLSKSKYFKLVCGAGYEEKNEVEYLSYIYTLAGCSGFDVSANPEIVSAVQKQMKSLIFASRASACLRPLPPASASGLCLRPASCLLPTALTQVQSSREHAERQGAAVHAAGVFDNNNVGPRPGYVAKMQEN